ncbi:MAG: class I SAM-dependent methyltransferase [Chitinophagaceae bacterium]|nr:class I SAM-dependent methyltransferase [Chitinophagaceae bacterium]
MALLKIHFKNLLQHIFPAHQIKRLHFYFEKAKYYYPNKKFCKANPGLALPNDEWLYETFQLNYKLYFKDGNLAAKEIFEWCSDYLQMEMPIILDWGCGTGRIVQHFHQFLPYALLYGADTNASMIAWNHQHIKSVYFSCIQQTNKTNYPCDYFDLIYGISVFTHLNELSQRFWVTELARVLKKGGILLVTTQGNFFKNKLPSSDTILFYKNGIVEKSFPASTKNLLEGDRNFSVYETSVFFEQLIETNFTIIKYFDGSIYPEKFGGHDLWILQKK